MASGSINLSSNQANANGRIDWQSTAYQSDNHSDVNAQVYVVLTGWGIQGTGAGQWKENGVTVNTFSPYVNIAWGGTGTVQVYSKNGIRVNHNANGDAGITLGCDMQFSFAGISNIGGSGWCTMDHIPRYATASISERSKTINTISINWSTDVATDHRRYSINGGGWTNVNETVASDNRSGYFTISNLEPNTSYNIKVQVKRTDSQLWSESNTITVVTYNYATLTEAPNITIGDDATIRYTNPSGASIQVGILQSSETIIAAYRTASGSSYTFEFTDEEINNMYNLIPSSTNVKLRYYITTVQNGKTYYNYLERTFSVNITESTPQIPEDFDVRCSDSNTITSDLTGSTLNGTISNNTFILNYSNALVNIYQDVSAKNGASINNYSITDGTTTKMINITSTKPYSETINKISRNIIELYVIDSRGLSSKKDINLTIVNYSAPIIDSVTNLKRVGGVGTSVNFIFSGSIWNKNFGAVTNSIKAFKYKKIPSTSNNWDSAEWIDIPNTKYTIDTDGNIKNVENAILTDFAIGTEFKVKIRLEDELDSKEIELEVSSGEPIMAWNKTKKIIGAGKIPDKNLRLGSIDALGDVISGNQLFTTYNEVKKEIMSFKGNVTDFNETLKTGFYFVDTNSKNGPYTESLYGYLEVWVSDGTSWNKTNNWIWQRFTDISNRIFRRYAVNNSSWYPWKEEMNSVDSIYPVGSIFVSIMSTNPGTLFGGTWQRIAYGRTLVGVDENQTEFDTVQKSGGHKSLQSHTHTMVSAGNHNHIVSYDQIWKFGGSTSLATTEGGPYNGSGYVKDSGSHTHTINNSGGGNAQNLQPYLTVYFWRRLS